MAREWDDVPAGEPAHHHCVMSIEHSHDPKNWVDHVNVSHHVAWTYPAAVEWVYEQLVAHHGETVEAHGFRASVEEALDSYVPAEVGAHVDHYRYRPEGTTYYAPSLWERLPQTFQMGRWAIEAWQLAPGRKLALQIMCYADAACTRHTRPSDEPYLGLTDAQAAHVQRYRGTPV